MVVMGNTASVVNAGSQVCLGNVGPVVPRVLLAWVFQAPPVALALVGFQVCKDPLAARALTGAVGSMAYMARKGRMVKMVKMARMASPARKVQSGSPKRKARK